MVAQAGSMKGETLKAPGRPDRAGPDAIFLGPYGGNTLTPGPQCLPDPAQAELTQNGSFTEAATQKRPRWGCEDPGISGSFLLLGNLNLQVQESLSVF